MPPKLANNSNQYGLTSVFWDFRELSPISWPHRKTSQEGKSRKPVCSNHTRFAFFNNKPRRNKQIMATTHHFQLRSSDIRCVTSTLLRSLATSRTTLLSLTLRPSSAHLRPQSLRSTPPFRLRAFSNGSGAVEPFVEKVVDNKPSICTADELHYVSVANSDWRLALWRYNPPPQVCLPSRPNILTLNKFSLFLILFKNNLNNCS